MEMKVAALVMEKLSSTSPSLSPCPCLPPSSQEVCRCWFLEDAQRSHLPTAAHWASRGAGPGTCSAPTRLKSAVRQRMTSHLLQWVPRIVSSHLKEPRLCSGTPVFILPSLHTEDPGLQGAECVWTPSGCDPEWILLSVEVNAIRVNFTLIYLKAFQKTFH